MKNPDHLIVQTDGGARGNPGPAAIGVVISDKQGNILKKYGEYLGEQTNNYAEYQAVISALKKIKQLFGKENAKTAIIDVFADSELLVKQMNHQYKVENESVQQLFLQLWNLIIDFQEVHFHAVPREQNKEADALVNETLDAQQKAAKLF
ncbi:MAG: ribonuclease HI family protein [Candidatus Wildermuthbacteria bacterium]|nr:ribonuclease HI family protein [Candidatus Wildermuthbacteria bacterium]